MLTTNRFNSCIINQINLHIFTCSSSPSRLIYCIFNEKRIILMIRLTSDLFRSNLGGVDSQLGYVGSCMRLPFGSRHLVPGTHSRSMPYTVFTIWFTSQGSFNEPGSHHPVSATWFPPPGLYQLNPQFTYSPTTSFPIYYIMRAI